MNTTVKADAATSAARFNQCPKDNFSFSIMFYPKAMSQPIPHQQPGGLAAGYFGLGIVSRRPLCIVAAVAFALSPLLTPGKRLAILSIGTGL